MGVRVESRSRRVATGKAGKSAGAAINTRRQPTQARAKQTVDLIIETAAEMLEETSIDSFNTNVLADRAGVRVRSVYRYFPNKFAVLAAVWDRMMHEWDEMLAPGLAQLGDPHQDIMVGFRGMAGAYIQWISERRGAWALRSIIRAVPELLEQEKLSEEWFVSHFARALRRRGVHASATRLRIISTVVFRAANAIVHTEFVLHQRPRRVVLREMGLLVQRYLNLYVPSVKPLRPAGR